MLCLWAMNVILSPQLYPQFVIYLSTSKTRVNSFHSPSYVHQLSYIVRNLLYPPSTIVRIPSSFYLSTTQTSMNYRIVISTMKTLQFFIPPTYQMFGKLTSQLLLQLPIVHREDVLGMWIPQTAAPFIAPSVHHLRIYRLVTLSP